MCNTNTNQNQPINPIPDFHTLSRSEQRWRVLMRKFELRKTVKAKQRIKRNAPTLFNGMLEFVEYFNSEEMCIAYFENIRWKDGKVFCPHCGFFEVWQLEDKINYRCKTCSKNFNVKTKTIFEAGKTSLRNWFMTIYLENSFVGGVTTGELERQLPYSRKTTGLMINKIRECGYNQNCFSTNVETENGQKTYVLDTMVRDGENRNRHDWRKRDESGGMDRKFILVVLQKGGYVRAYPVDGTEGGEVLPHIYNHMPDGATVYTDEHASFKALGRPYEQNLIFEKKLEEVKRSLKERPHRIYDKRGKKIEDKEYPSHAQFNSSKKQFNHHCVNHSQKNYGIGDISTNAVEGWNSYFQAGLGKFRNSISKTFTDLFVNAAVFRYNTCRLNETEKLDLVLTNICTYHAGTMAVREKAVRIAKTERDKQRTAFYQGNKLEEARVKAETIIYEKKKADSKEHKAGVEQRRKARQQRKADEAQKKLDKAQKKADKETAKQQAKQAKEQKKADKETAKQQAKQAREQRKADKETAKQQAKQAGKQRKAGRPKKINIAVTTSKAKQTTRSKQARQTTVKK